ncbi:hypothetical protein GCM10009746_13900 [Microbacterium paludicola]
MAVGSRGWGGERAAHANRARSDQILVILREQAEAERAAERRCTAQWRSRAGPAGPGFAGGVSGS